IEVTVVETVEATKPIISIEVTVVETVEAGRGVKRWTALHRHPSHGSSHWSAVPSHLCRRSRDRENGWHHATEENEFFPVHNVIGFLKIEPGGLWKLRPATVRKGNAVVTFPMRRHWSF